MIKVGDAAQQIDVAQILKDPSVIKIYVNGLTVGMSLSDVFMVVNSGPMPSAVIQMSFTTAKTMMQSLTQLITGFEENTGQPLLTMEDIKNKCFGGRG